MTIFENFHRTPEPIQGAQVAEHTAAEIATWCGGTWGHERDRGVDSYLEVVVPNIEGNLKAHVNDWVVRKANGRFYVMKAADLKEQGYKKSGARIDGITTVKQPDFEIPKDLPGGSDLVQSFTPHYVARGQHPFGN